jgi:hypothetical protein
MWFLALFSVVLSGVLLALSIFPGLLEQIPERPAIIVGGGFALLAAGLAAWHLVRPARQDRPRRRTSALVVLVVMIVTPLLLAMHVPRRIVFARYRPHFEALLADAPAPGDQRVANLNADFSLFWVDQWGTDARGGTYFRTLTGAAPHRRSFGFAYQPNSEGSPFGDVGYELQHLGGDWYSFAASDR